MYQKMFTDCISDDLIYIRQFKEISVDGKKKNNLPIFCIPSLCRLLIVSSVSGIDHFLNYSEAIETSSMNPYKNSILDLIKQPNHKQYKLAADYLKIIENKIETFYDFAKGKAFEISLSEIREFIAIRMIRNAIVHCSWINNSKLLNEDQKKVESLARIAFVTQNGFPEDFMKFDESHWSRITNVEEKFQNFLYANSILDTN